MGRLEMDLNGRHIHLAVEGSTGGTTVGLHFAADTIASGKRVLWASTDMPNPSRFSQLFEHLSLVESSRFHAMNFGGRFDRAIDALLEAATSLPSVGLVVLDDWCEASGRIPKDSLEQISRFRKEAPPHICILLISKGSIDASGTTNEPILARAAEHMSKSGYEIWRLWRAKEGGYRTLDCAGECREIKLEDSGVSV